MLLHVGLVLQEGVRLALLSLHVEDFVLVGFDLNGALVRRILPLLAVVFDQLGEFRFE